MLSLRNLIRLPHQALALAFAICALSLELSAQDPPQDDQEAARFFHEQIEPLLKKHCYACHSHQSQTMEGGLALDWQSGWETGGSRGTAIVREQPDQSLLIRAIRHEDAELQMPEEKLSDREIELLTRWVRTGAFDDRVAVPVKTDPRDWWSLKPLVSSELPAASELSTSTGESPSEMHPIDAFVDARLRQQGLNRSPRALPRELLRRVYYDLTGLPPTPEQVEAFDADPSQLAYDAIVDQLLASSHYGERWARHWMDTIHFAESHGYEHDVGRDHAWPYRDYLIQSLNADKDWATLIREQLAVDYFKPEATELIPALGFLGAGTFDLSTYSTGPVTFDYMDRDDMLAQTTAAFISSTANCARCHDHKFDPISQEDYYSLQAVFSGLLKGDLLYDPDPRVAAQRKKWREMRDAAMRRDETALQSPAAQALLTQWIAEHQAVATWTDLRPVSFLSSEGATLTRNAEGVILASGGLPDVDTYTVTGMIELPSVSAIRLDLFPDDSLPMKGPGRCGNGNLHLSEVVVSVFAPGAAEGKVVKIVRATADFNQDGWGIERSIDADPKTAWGIHPEVGKAHRAVFEFQEPLKVAPGSHLTVVLRQLHGGSHLIGAFRLSLTDAVANLAEALPADVEAALREAKGKRTPAQLLAIASYAVSELAASQLALLPERSRVYAAGAAVEIPDGNGKYRSDSLAAPKVVHLLHRGDIDKPKHVVAPGALSVLDHLPARFDSSQTPEPARRAALAEWLAHRDNVLTWRSVVNRVWHYHFGRGLCDTPSDLGRMGGVPSHPELIDWLAVWFRDQAHGSLKKLHRLIVTSQTYQQSSHDLESARLIDADNRLLWRQRSHRLDADGFQDFVLCAAGTIDLKMGGPSVQHFKQSPGPQATPNLDYVTYDWTSPGANRRSIYRYVWRSIPDPLMSVLDFPDLGLLSPVRSESFSPLQSLALLNNSFVLHFSGAMADEIAREESDPAKQVSIAVRRTLLREPDAEERSQMETHLRQHGLASLCRILFNSNEFLFVP